MKKLVLSVIILIIVATTIGYLLANSKGKSEVGDEIADLETEMQEIQVTSPAFPDGKEIPQKYTCDGEDINPPLQISSIPAGASSLVLIVDDPDAPMGTWSHWLVWNIDPSTNSVDENSVPEGAVLGKNDFGKLEYGGPCPPSGTHRYFFKVFALDTKLDLSEGSGRDELETAMQNHISAQGQLVGKYSR